MSYKTIHIVVEGACERDFIQAVVAPVFGMKEIFINASILGSGKHKGGNVKFERVLKDIENYLKQRKDTVISTMVDYFRLDSQWPGMDELQRKRQEGLELTLAEELEILTEATKKAIKAKLSFINGLEKRFIPYIQMHEYEALLFSDIQILVNHLSIDESKLLQIYKDYKTPEHINTDPNKSPANRLVRLSQNNYHKRRDGIIIAQLLGLDPIRQQCPLFNQWLINLETSAVIN